MRTTTACIGFGRPGGRATWVCTGPISYKPQLIQIDIANFKTALNDEKVEEAFMPVVAPATVEMGRRNEYYPNDEAYLYAIADALKEEYRGDCRGRIPGPAR